MSSLKSLLAVIALSLPTLGWTAGVAEVRAVQYPAWIESANGKIPVVPGMQLKAQEVIASGDDARVLLTLPDGSEMKLGQNSRFSITRLNSNSTPSGTKLEGAMTLLAGKFRYATNAIAKLTGTRKIDVKLATATIGLRGTDYWAMSDADHDAVCLFEGKVEVATSDQGDITLDKPSAFWVRYFQKPPQAPGNATADQLATFLGWVEMTPGAGVAVADGRWRIIAAAEKHAADAQSIATALKGQGYPAAVVKSYGLHEVRLSNFASRKDAETVLKRLGATAGLSGNDARIVATR